MRVSTRTVIDIATGEIVQREAYEYQGPVSLAISAGGGGSKKESKAQSTSGAASGYNYNEPFLNLMFGREGQFYGDPYEAVKDPETGTITYERRERAPGVFGPEPSAKADYVTPNYTGAKYTPGQFTAVAPEGFKKLEDVAYQSQASKLGEAYKQNVARQREELSQAGALNSPAQYLEGSVRSSMDRSYLDSLQQAARDAFSQRLGLEEREAGRRTGYDVGEATRQTGYDVSEAARQTGFDVGEATRQTTFNQKEIDDLWKRFMDKIGVALEASKFGYSGSQSTQASDEFAMNMQGSIGSRG